MRKSAHADSHHADPGPAALQRRLDQLYRAWTLENAWCVGAIGATLLGAALAATRGRKWLILPAAVAGSALQHALTGTCVSSFLLREFGFRDRTDIERERVTVKHMLKKAVDCEAIARFEGEGGPPAD